MMTSYIPMIAWQTSVSLTGPGSSAYPSNVTIASSFGFSSNLYGVILNVLCFGVGGGLTFWNLTSFDFFGFQPIRTLFNQSKIKVGCVFPNVAVSLLPHGEFGPNDHQEDASFFRKKLEIKIETVLSELSILPCFCDWSLRRFFISSHAPMNL